MPAIRFIATWLALWVASLVGFGVILKATYNVFMWGWNLL